MESEMKQKAHFRKKYHTPLKNKFGSHADNINSWAADALEYSICSRAQFVSYLIMWPNDR